MASETEVLIVGAGPTGLVLALFLQRLGVSFRIIDGAASPGETSRALAVHARTLEFYDQIGLAGAVIVRGVRIEAVGMWARGRARARATFGDIGKGLSPYPYALVFPQDEHERLLIDRLAERGVEVERPLSLAGFEETKGGTAARLIAADGAEEQVEAKFIAGCDGARSRVREVFGSGFPGGTYSRMFYVADVEASGPIVNGDLNIGLDAADFLAVFPLKGAGRVRLVGDLNREGSEDLSFDDVGHAVIDRLGIEIKAVNWFSSYRVHHRVAAKWRSGPAFLLGDAAHIHSPVGGQGMNTGIGDAVNLAWKLAAVLKGAAGETLLDTYEPERIAFAHRLIASTDRAFKMISRDDALARFARLVVVPAILPPLTRLPAFRRLLFRTVSQINVNYQDQALAAGEAGKVKAGDRLPWVKAADNFAPLRSLAWRGQVHGDPEAGLTQACAQAGLPLDCFAWTADARQAGLHKDAFHLVRPDGYVALAAEDAAPAALAQYQARHELRFQQGD
ncbi:MAG TPA: FAD-dependent monooxygenase [Caulobacteraceae bacterium]|jgi:2-polyprenyl-6-methoxyphenol hydroxylase-like FAD-dependent oxidoreductase